MATSTITTNDLKRIETSLKKVLDATKQNNPGPEYLELLNRLTDTVNDLRLRVEFDHEKRLQAIEDFLQEL